MAIGFTDGGYNDPNASLHGDRVHDVEKHLGALHQDLTRDYNPKISRRRFIDESYEGHSVDADQIRIFEDNFIVGDDATGHGGPVASTSIIGVTYHLSGRQNVSEPLDAPTGPKALEASLRNHGDFCPAWSVCIDQYKGQQVSIYEGYDAVDVLPALKGVPLQAE